MNKSLGHVTTAHGREFFHGPDGTLYAAPEGNPLDLGGYRQGARFECMPRSDGHRAFLWESWKIGVPCHTLATTAS